MSITYISNDAMINHAAIIIDNALENECKKYDLQYFMDTINDEMVAMQDAHGGTRHIFTMPAYVALEKQWMEYHAQYQALL